MDSTVSSSKDTEQVLGLCQDNSNSLQRHQTHVGLWKEKKNKHLCILNERDGQGMAYD